MTLHRTLGYVTYQDIRSVGSLRDQTVIAVKAPADTQLEVPDTAGVRDHSLSLSLSVPGQLRPDENCYHVSTPLIQILCILLSLQQSSLQIYLKSKNGPIEVYLCPEEGLEDASPVKSAVTPKKEFPQPLGPPTTTTPPTVPPSYSIKEEPVECKPSSL